MNMLLVPSSLLPIMSDNILVRMIRKYTHKIFQGPQYRISVFTVLVKNTAKHKRHKIFSEIYIYIYIYIYICICVCVCVRAGKEMKTREGFGGSVFYNRY